MKPRPALVSLFAACLASVPAMASQPDGLVGKLIANPHVTTPAVGDSGLPGVTCGGFHWTEFFTSRTLDPADTLTLEMAIIPFRSGGTVVSLGESVRSSSFVQIQFMDGLVNGLPYNRLGWNDLTVHLRPATQDYMMTVNGATAGPFAYDSACQQQGGCLTVDALGFSGGFGDEPVAWIDTISLVRESAAGPDTLFQEAFDICTAPRVILGGLLLSDPPRRLTPRRAVAAVPARVPGR